jgi:hypothetical protein
MTRDEAHSILDAARAGVDISVNVINRALWVTGDLAGRHSNQHQIVEAAKTIVDTAVSRVCSTDTLHWASRVVALDRARRETAQRMLP